MKSVYTILVTVLCFIAHASADTPANCTYEDISGKWTFRIGTGGHDRTLNCSSFTGRLSQSKRGGIAYNEMSCLPFL